MEAKELELGNEAVESVESKETHLTKSTESNTLAVASKDGMTSFEKRLSDANKVAELIAKSSIGKLFEKVVETKDGKVMVVNKEDIVVNILTGAELGFTPMKSVMYGSKLDTDAILKVDAGVRLGLTPESSLDSIYVIPTQGGRTIYTSANVIEGVLVKRGIRIELLEDYIPTYGYLNVQTKQLITEFDDKLHVEVNSHNEAYIKEKVKEGLAIVLKKITGRQTTVRLTRGSETQTITYTIQDAIDAGFYPGTHSITGETTDKPKSNWVNHTKAMMRKMALVQAARLIANDYLKGLYSDIELVSTKQSNVKDVTDDTTEVDYEEVF